MLRQHDMIRPVMLINYNDGVCQYLLACFAYVFLYPLTSFQRFGARHLASLLAVSTNRIKWCCLYLDDKLLEAYSDVCCMSCQGLPGGQGQVTAGLLLISDSALDPSTPLLLTIQVNISAAH